MVLTKNTEKTSKIVEITDAKNDGIIGETGEPQIDREIMGTISVPETDLQIKDLVLPESLTSFLED